jgi:ATP-dependent Clp protease ATP-binding subunit ClpA
MPARSAGEVWKTTIISAGEEARRRGDRRLGTDHLLLGLLHDEGSTASRALGVPLADARAASDALDAAALRAVGVEVERLDEGFPTATSRRLPPLNSGARAVLKQVADEARPRRRRRIDGTHVLRALLVLEPPDPAAQLLQTLGIDRDAVRERLSHAQEGGAL